MSGIEVAPGTVVAERYRVVRPIAEGGMGTVYLVEHLTLPKKFAMKLLPEDASKSPESVVRFEREAIAAARVVHPNVVSATDYGRLPDGSFYLVLEYVEGACLRDVIRRGPLHPRRAFSIARQMLLALAASHGKGVIHRDVKPDNVMLCAPEERTSKTDPDLVKVLDFGIAKLDKAIGGGPITAAGVVYGTPIYMSPEQAMAGTVDHRVDLYALGIVLYEMIAGTPPFDGKEDVTILAKHVTHPVPPLKSAVDDATLTEAARHFVSHLLEKKPDARPATADAALAELELALVSMNVRKAQTAPPPSSASMSLGEKIAARTGKFTTFAKSYGLTPWQLAFAFTIVLGLMVLLVLVGLGK